MKMKHSLVLWMSFALLNSQVQARLSISTSNALQRISSSMTSAGKNVQTRVNAITDYLNSEDGSNTVDQVSGALETIGGAVGSLTSSDTFEIVSGAMTVMAAITSLIPVYGTIISTVFSLVSTIFGAVGGGSDDVGSIVRREIERALNNYDDSQLRSEATGTIRVYKNSQAYLSAREGNTTINEHEVAALAANIPVYQGVEFLGILTEKIKDNSKRTDETQVKRASEYVQLYVTLAVMRSSILWQMYSLVRAAPNSDWTADAIKRFTEAEEETDKTFLTFLETPEYSQAVFFAFFNPSQWPVTMKFMSEKSLSYQRLSELEGGSHSLRTEEYPTWYAYMPNEAVGSIKGTTTLDDQGRFYFDVINREDNIFYLRSVYWIGYYVYMASTSEAYCQAYDGHPGPQGEWKVVKFSDGKYMLSTREWPNWFIYMESSAIGFVKGCEGDPGTQGHWMID